MNKFISKNLIKSNNLLISLTRCVTYEVSPTGEKVYMDKLHSLDKDPKPNKKEKWQRVAPMGYEQQLKDIKKIEFDPRLESDPLVAKSTAFSKLESMKDTLRNRGFEIHFILIKF